MIQRFPKAGQVQQGLRRPIVQTIYLLLAMVLAYLLGSVPFAVLVSKSMGLADPRSFGSGNPGATNVLRSGSKLAAVLTLLLDAAKGWLPVALVGWFGARWGLWEGAQAAVGLAAFAGHVWSVFLRFKGGKGVATALGVLLGISPWLGLWVLLSWVLVLAVWRYSSLSSVLAALLAPLFYIVAGGTLWAYDRWVLLAVAAMSAILLMRHAGNINRLMQGKEPKVGQKKTAAGAATPGQRHK
jgi:glycerol-3-phosphate acyltransferase PlsY